MCVLEFISLKANKEGKKEAEDFAISSENKLLVEKKQTNKTPQNQPNKKKNEKKRDVIPEDSFLKHYVGCAMKPASQFLPTCKQVGWLRKHYRSLKILMDKLWKESASTSITCRCSSLVCCCSPTGDRCSGPEHCTVTWKPDIDLALLLQVKQHLEVFYSRFYHSFLMKDDTTPSVHNIDVKVLDTSLAVFLRAADWRRTIFTSLCHLDSSSQDKTAMLYVNLGGQPDTTQLVACFFPSSRMGKVLERAIVRKLIHWMV